MTLQLFSVINEVKVNKIKSIKLSVALSVKLVDSSILNVLFIEQVIGYFVQRNDILFLKIVANKL